jgi:HAD superfamily hydrolase (TIGR01484 family)
MNGINWIAKGFKILGSRMQNLFMDINDRGKPILCFDLDGTLLNEREEIHPADCRILAGEMESALFIPATGRTLESIRRTFRRNGLFNDRKIPLPLVLQNGSLLYKGYEVFQSFHPFEPDIQDQLVDSARQFAQVTFLFMGITETHILSATATGLDAAERYEFTTHLFTPDSCKLQFSKLMCIPERPGDLNGFLAMTDLLPLERAFSTPTILELTPRGVNKGIGLGCLIDALEISPGFICAAGDAENDLPLCDLADKFFVPTGALEQVKARAAQVVDVKRDGLLQPMLDAI